MKLKAKAQSSLCIPWRHGGTWRIISIHS